MRKMLLLSAGILLCANVAFGQAGVIAVFADPSYTSCYYADLAPALLPVYVVHISLPGATASKFQVSTGGGFTGTYTGEYSPMPTVTGNSQTGIEIGYGTCYTGWILILTVNYFCTGTSQDCAWIDAVSYPFAPDGRMEVVDCSDVLVRARGQRLWISSDAYSCGDCEIFNLPAAETSWGQVKALFE